MATALEAKLMIHQAAATLAAGVLANAPDNLSPKLADDGSLPKDVADSDLLVWQLHKIFYTGLVGALASTDKAAWPEPPADAVAAMPASAKPILDALQQLAASLIPQLLPLVQGLLTKAVPAPTPATQSLGS